MMIKLKTLLNPDIIHQIVDFQLMDNTINKKIRNRGNIICVLILIVSIYIAYGKTEFYQTIFMVYLIFVCSAIFFIWYVNCGIKWFTYWELYRCYYPEKEDTYIVVNYTFSEEGILIEKEGNLIFTTWDSLKIFRIEKDYYYMKINSSYYVIKKSNISDKVCRQLENLISRRKML